MAKRLYQESYLNQFSVDQLYALLEMELHSGPEEEAEVPLQLLAAIERKENAMEEAGPAETVDVDAAWQEFQTYYNIPEGEGQALYPIALEKDRGWEAGRTSTTGGNGGRKEAAVPAGAKSRRVLRFAAAVAAAAVLMFSGMLAAQASGLNVFGTLERWTDSTLSDGDTYRETRAHPPKDPGAHRAAFQERLSELGLDPALAPAWRPKGFRPTGLRAEGTKELNGTVWCSYYNRMEDRSYRVLIGSVPADGENQLVGTEQDGSSAETYQHGARTFSFTSGLDRLTAVWSDGSVILHITGDLSREEMIEIIDSIGM